jgi:hypothetical protein
MRYNSSDTKQLRILEKESEQLNQDLVACQEKLRIREGELKVLRVEVAEKQRVVEDVEAEGSGLK